MTAEFEKYKELNDLDAYFAKNLSKESRERVINNVKVLMSVTDWHSYDPVPVLMAEPANTEWVLHRVLTESKNQYEKRTSEIA